MPELPEVETIVRGLQPALPGKVIERARVLWERTLAEPALQQFLTQAAGQRIEQVTRRGKFIVVGLKRGTLLVHLRMSGDLRLEAVPSPDLPHDRLVLDFSDGTRLAFNDARKFGRIWLLNDPLTVLGNLGPEPLAPGFTVEVFSRLLGQRRRQLKPLLLDQSFVAGLGNIYTDEALHLARLHPCYLADSLSALEVERLHAAIRSVLEEGIRRNGASIDWVYRGGDFQNHFRVYQRTGQACPECGAKIQRMVVGQRGTHFCPHCQPPA